MSTHYDNYKAFIQKASTIFENRIYTDYLRRFAYGTDASCYRYIPKAVIIANDEEDIKKILSLSLEFNVAVTFRAAGTSLSGQASSESILVVASHRWQDIELADDKSSIFLQCGVIGSMANAVLKPYGKKIGPDPATINHAMIGGIFNNNSSGMCCGVKQNSYNTIKSVRVILSDGSVLDTSDRACESENLATFIKEHEPLVTRILNLREAILQDRDLVALIKRKYAIKNTTGYAINSLIDFADIKDILNHIFIGSEGTLAFTSKVEYECVDDHPCKACALIFYKDIMQASYAVASLSANQSIVASAEIMDYQCLLSASSAQGAPASLAYLQEGQCALLVQLEDIDEAALDLKISYINQILSDFESVNEIVFSKDSQEIEDNWKIRKSILPLCASLRPSGSTVITEDICFDIDNFTAGINDIITLFDIYNFKGSVFGHALAGNVHFIITPNLNDESEAQRFGAFMEAMVDMVSKRGGSSKAEHGTGRMVAPFVEKEWGAKAYAVNKEIKAIFDPKNLINPDVIISDDPKIHVKNFKQSCTVDDFIDACMECGFCEKACPSREFTLTPRQRITVRREIIRLESMNFRTKEQDLELSELKKGYKFYALDTCATCSMCSTLCPLEIDTANIAKKLLPAYKGPFKKYIASKSADNFATALSMARLSINTAKAASFVLGGKRFGSITRGLNAKLSIPFVPESMPSAHNPVLKSKDNGGDLKVIYFSSCINRVIKAMPAKDNEQEKTLQMVFESVCKKAKVDVIYPTDLKHLCCGKAYKDYPKAAEKKKHELFVKLQTMLLEDENTCVICDHSACSYDLINEFKGHMGADRVFDMPVFVEKYLLPRLNIVKSTENIAIYPVCSTYKGKWSESLFNIARVCTDGQVLKHEGTMCCGFAGDKGFSCPDLNTSALKNLSAYYKKSCAADPSFKRGFSSAATCEIGLNDKTTLVWSHIISLVDECSH